MNPKLKKKLTGLRQERPPHLRGDHIHPAMIERGRAIPNTQSVPIVTDRPQRASDHVQIIDGRVSVAKCNEIFKLINTRKKNHQQSSRKCRP